MSNQSSSNSNGVWQSSQNQISQVQGRRSCQMPSGFTQMWEANVERLTKTQWLQCMCNKNVAAMHQWITATSPFPSGNALHKCHTADRTEVYHIAVTWCTESALVMNWGIPMWQDSARSHKSLLCGSLGLHTLHKVFFLKTLSFLFFNVLAMFCSQNKASTHGIFQVLLTACLLVKIFRHIVMHGSDHRKYVSPEITINHL